MIAIGRFSRLVTPLLESDERRAFACMISSDFPVAYAEIGMTVSFRPTFWPSRISRTFWFKTQANRDGSPPMGAPFVAGLKALSEP